MNNYSLDITKNHYFETPEENYTEPFPWVVRVKSEHYRSSGGWAHAKVNLEEMDEAFGDGGWGHEPATAAFRDSSHVYYFNSEEDALHFCLKYS